MVRSYARTLATLRDALLPMRLSAELRVAAGIAAGEEGPSRNAVPTVGGAGVSSKERAPHV